jgi:hypothetical protein
MEGGMGLSCDRGKGALLEMTNEKKRKGKKCRSAEQEIGRTKKK